ncbi:hydroxyethylthiazole kinase [Butyrivibrio sp. AD3002]|uniref:hydroxyethylthiazole kinase n=1 Tax=Butyrivibrio sp. AD3002 TaxID=1280670 RepID=UPI0003B66160|nr:hydroxyethylthiazole kinase [Butyrivibrio sp. AD3002]
MSELIHCITNPISMMQCANAILALGAKPIMAEHPLEVREITESASALVINLGNISDTRMESMEISFETALEKNIPVVIDAVGVACSKLRRDFVMRLLKMRSQKPELSLREKGILLIKGNYSEIKAIFDESYRGVGVDADESLGASEIADIVRMLALNLGVIALASGEKDIVSDGSRTFFIRNGNPMMGVITGTGCMLGAICGVFLARNASIEAVTRAAGFFGIAGEIAYERAETVTERLTNGEASESMVGSGSFLVELLNAISMIDEETVKSLLRCAEEKYSCN